MLIENLAHAASLQRQIENAEKQVEEIEDYPLDKLIFQRVHGRSIEIPTQNEQTIYAIKQLLIIGLRATVKAKELELLALL